MFKYKSLIGPIVVHWGTERFVGYAHAFVIVVVQAFCGCACHTYTWRAWSALRVPAIGGKRFPILSA